MELAKHADLIDDERVKAYVIKKKQQRIKEKEERILRTQGKRGIHAKMAGVESDDEEMEESSEQEVQMVKATATVRRSTRNKAIKK